MKYVFKNKPPKPGWESGEIIFVRSAYAVDQKQILNYLADLCPSCLFNVATVDDEYVTGFWSTSWFAIYFQEVGDAINFKFNFPDFEYFQGEVKKPIYVSAMVRDFSLLTPD